MHIYITDNVWELTSASSIPFAHARRSATRLNPLVQGLDPPEPSKLEENEHTEFDRDKTIPLCQLLQALVYSYAVSWITVVS
jgi:hypothetical protein